MSKFIIQPHFRLQEWVAEAKGYFAAEGLDYEFRETVQASDGKAHDKGDKVGAYQMFEQGGSSDVTCACHWTVNVAAAASHGKLLADVYSVSPAGVFVPASSDIRTPEDMMGMLFHRMELLLNGKIPAATLFSGPYYLAEQLGFRKIIDATFMMTTMISGNPDPDDLKKYLAALKRAQRDIDLRPERYTHYYRNEFPHRFHDMMDTRRWGPGERIVFEPYTREVFEDSRAWIREREIFDGDNLGADSYENAIIRLT
jgi:hypothetical protein